MMNLNHSLLFALAIIFSACAQLGTPAPRNIEQSIVYTQGGLTAAYRTVGDLVVQGAMTPDQRNNVVSELDKGYDAIKLAKLAYASGNLTESTTLLGKASAILQVAETIIRSLEKK